MPKFKNHFHLPDLPNAGYSTTREKRLSDEIMMFMRDMERDRFRLLTVVIEGLATWRKAARSIWNGYKIEDAVVDEIFHYFELQAVRPKTQKLLLRHHGNPQKWREIMALVQPHLEAEREQVRLTQKWSPFDATVN